MATDSLPRIRAGVDATAVGYPGLSADQTQALLIDQHTGYQVTLTLEESAVIFYLIANRPARTRKELIEYADRLFRIRLDDAAIESCLSRFHKLQLFAETAAKDAATLASNQLEARRADARERKLAALQALVTRLGTEVPYYRDLFAKTGCTRQPLSSLDDVRNLPLFTKQDMRTNLHRIQPEWFKEDAFPTTWASTSGTTGERTQVVRLGSEWRLLSKPVNMLLGLPPIWVSNKCCWMSPPVCSGTECHMDMAVPREQRLHPTGGTLFLNASRDPCRASEEYCQHVVDEITDFQPVVLLVDCNYFAPVARYLLEKEITLESVRYLMTDYEIATGVNRRIVERALGLKSQDFVWPQDVGLFGMQCPRSNLYHVNPDYHVEILKGDRPAAPGEVGRLVITSLASKLSPVLRFDNGDLAVATDETCDCQLAHQAVFKSHEGRLNHVITDVEGRPLTTAAVDRGIVEADIGYYCLAQLTEKKYRFEYRRPASGQAPEKTEQLAAELLHQLLGAAAEVRMEARDSIAPQTNGKFRLTYQEEPGDLRRFF